MNRYQKNAKTYVATVQIEVNAQSEDEARAQINTLFRPESLVQWGNVSLVEYTIESCGIASW